MNCDHNKDCPQVIDDVISYTLTWKITITTSCACLILMLTCAIRALVFSTKLPHPFKTLCIILLCADVILAFTTAVQLWIKDCIGYERDVIGICSLMVSLATTLLGLERAFALKYPLKYIGCSVSDRLVPVTAISTYAALLLLYLCVRFLVCYKIQLAVNGVTCLSCLRFYILSVEALFTVTSSACLVFILATIAKGKIQHTRRITRMGLPQNHASKATDARVSAVLFLVYPFQICLVVFGIISPYWSFIQDKLVAVWLSLAFRIALFVMHGIMFNVWFDEGRLHLLTMVSPLSAYLRERADMMRINVYNIVIAAGSQPDGGEAGRHHRVSRRRGAPESSNVSVCSIFLSRLVSQNSIFPSVHEQRI